MLSISKERFQERIKTIENELESDLIGPNCVIVFYDLHDGSMLYLLTKYFFYKKKYYLFVLCKGQRGQGVIDENHQC